jgi:hypothetical protein
MYRLSMSPLSRVEVIAPLSLPETLRVEAERLVDKGAAFGLGRYRLSGAG